MGRMWRLTSDGEDVGGGAADPQVFDQGEMRWATGPFPRSGHEGL